MAVLIENHDAQLHRRRLSKKPVLYVCWPVVNSRLEVRNKDSVSGIDNVGVWARTAEVGVVRVVINMPVVRKPLTNGDTCEALALPHDVVTRQLTSTMPGFLICDPVQRRLYTIHHSGELHRWFLPRHRSGTCRHHEGGGNSKWNRPCNSSLGQPPPAN